MFQPSYLYQWKYICKPHQLSTLDLNSTMQRWTWISVHYTQTYQWRFPFMLTQFTKTKPRITAHNRYRWYDKSHTSLMFCSLYVWLCNLLKALELEYNSDLNTLRFVNTRSFQSQTMLYILFIFFWKVHVKHKHNSMHIHYGITNQMFSNEEPGIQPHSFYWFLCSMIMPYREYSLFPMHVHQDDCIHCTPHQWN